MKDHKYKLKIKNALFIFFMFNISFLIFTPTFVNAYDTGSHSAQATESSKADYVLSYPGLLPDHPLYFIKAGRDRIMSFFISKPLKKAEFNLLQADKRVEASRMLIKKGESKIDLAQSTFSKAENYFEGAINNTITAKMQGIDTTEFSKKLDNSNQKHQQVLKDIIKLLNEKDKNKFVTEHERLEQFEKKVKELNPKQ